MGFPCSGDLALKSLGGHYFRKTLLKLLNRAEAVLQLAATLGIYGEITTAIYGYCYLRLRAADNTVAIVPLSEFASPPKGQAN